MKLILISGYSGSGKSIALAALEDGGFYCVDNLPARLLGDLVEVYKHGLNASSRGLAIGIDARAPEADLRALPAQIAKLKRTQTDIRITLVFLEATENRLIARFSETRRRHPLSVSGRGLASAVEREMQLLAAVREAADLIIDTSSTTVHQLRETIQRRLLEQHFTGPSVLIQSFGFKRGIPLDTDFLFDVRHLPNPHWDASLRGYSGLDGPVIRFLEQHPAVDETLSDIFTYLRVTLKRFTHSDRSYITISIGCTGGKHRSVYLVERLMTMLAPTVPGLTQRHRDLK